MVISSASNEQIKKIIQLKEKAKARKSEGLFIVEGIKMFREAPPEDLVKVYVSESFWSEKLNTFQNDKPNASQGVGCCRESGNSSDNRSFLEGVDYQIVSDSVFKKISDTVTPQGVLAIVRQKKYNMQDLLNTIHEGRNCFVILDRIQDPGNLGTIIRTGEGAGINGVIMSDTTADIYNPKVIRSTMGSIYRVPFVIAPDLVDAIKELKAAGVTSYAAHLKGESYNKEEFPDKTALLIGNEANGLSDEVSKEADRLIKIPMQGKVESLNAAVATAILMYQVMGG